MSALALSQVVQGARDIAQMGALGAAYLATGNLAAPYVAAVVNQLLLTALQAHGTQRARKVRTAACEGAGRCTEKCKLHAAAQQSLTTRR